MVQITCFAKRMLMLLLFSALVSGCYAFSDADSQSTAPETSSDDLMGTGDLGLIVERATGSLLVINTTSTA